MHDWKHLWHLSGNKKQKRIVHHITLFVIKYQNLKLKIWWAYNRLQSQTSMIPLPFCMKLGNNGIIVIWWRHRNLMYIPKHMFPTFPHSVTIYVLWPTRVFSSNLAGVTWACDGFTISQESYQLPMNMDRVELWIHHMLMQFLPGWN